ncbi:MAG TPA: methionine adenosyltransferase [Ignavibacteriaceae bacterium]|nr:methionine adenosyltransferase [Ignavibacteriaceae bacterium]
MPKQFLFTSESVSEGHPDKVADQISDAILDAHLKEDAGSRVACETLIANNLLVIAGEITSGTKVDYEQTAKNIIREIGYNGSFPGFDPDRCETILRIHRQSPDIAVGVDRSENEKGAGDQGLMFGYATSETPEMMPLPLQLSHKLLLHLSGLRKRKVVDWLRPDSKSQVTVKYENGKPLSVERVVISTQHSESVSQETIREFITDEVIKKVIPDNLISGDVQLFINPTGRFVEGGPYADTGLTGRKIIVDTYGGSAPHGGGAFSGKDPSKVDRSAAYMARYVAKNIVAAGLASRCTIQLSYAIGVIEPLSVTINLHGESKELEEKLIDVVPHVFDLTPAGIVRMLDLKRPVYLPTAAYGHFGRDGFSWEKTDKTEELLKKL